MISVTGATGFVGRPLVRQLCKDGVALEALVRDEAGIAHTHRAALRRVYE